MTTTIHRGDFVQWMREREWLVQNGYIPKAHAVFCDPPYGLAFMNSKWDDMGPLEYQQWVTDWGRLMLSYVYPGAVLAAFGGTRTYHRLAAGLEDVGWIVFDCMMWTYSSGFPKSHNIGKAIDAKFKENEETERRRRAISLIIAKHRTEKELTRSEVSEKVVGTPSGACWNWEHIQLPSVDMWAKIKEVLGIPDRYDSLITGDRSKWIEAEREILATRTDNGKRHVAILGTEAKEYDITAPATDAARQWDGYGTALSPAYEPIILARAPWSGTYAGIAQQYGTGAINVDGGRIPTEESDFMDMQGRSGGHTTYGPNDNNVALGKGLGRPIGEIWQPKPLGRWPKNLLLSCACPTDDHAPDCPVRILGEQSGETGNGYRANGSQSKDDYFGLKNGPVGSRGHDDTGTAARMFYQAKAAAWEREAGLHDRPAVTVNDGRQTPIDNPYQRGETKRRNIHPTLKPIQLTQYLSTLLLPPALSEPRRLLVPFSGSGSEMIGAMLAGWDDVVGFEQSGEYADIAEARIAWWSQFSDYDQAKRAYDADRGEQAQRVEEAAHGMRQLALLDALEAGA